MKRVSHLIMISSLLFSMSCSSRYEKSFEQNSGVDNSPALDKPAEQDHSSKNGYVHTIASKMYHDTSKKFIRTADLIFQVENVRNATYAIEDVVSKFHGYVHYTNLKSDVLFTENFQVNQDTILELTHYIIRNNMVIRIPNSSLDTLLKEIAKQVDFLNSRVVEANDISISLLEKRLQEQSSMAYSKRLQKAEEKKASELKDIGKVEERIYNNQQMINRSKVEALKLQDQVTFSTVKLNFSQPKAFKLTYSLEQQFTSYQPSFWMKFKNNFLYGWNILLKIILFLIKCWVVIPVVLSCFAIASLILRIFKRDRTS